MEQDSNLRPKTLKLVKENTAKTFQVAGIG